MVTCTHSIPDPSCEVCGLRPLARNHYFDGKWMASHQFQVEQNYVRGANQRQNAYLHGVGTVCGLKIAQHPNPDCRPQYVVLKEGLAIDCCGHEIVVPEDRVLDVRAALLKELQRQQLAPEALRSADREPYTLRIMLEYRERGAEPVPALLDSCDDGSAEECDQILESYGWKLSLERESPPGNDDPAEPSLSWRQTLTVARPGALALDRDAERLFVAEVDEQGGAVRAYNTETHDLLAYAPILAQPGQAVSAAALSRNGERLYVAFAPDEANGLAARIVFVDRSALERGALPDVAAEALPFVALPAGRQVVSLVVAARDDALLAVVANSGDGLGATLSRWSADALADFLAAWDPANPGANAPASADRDLTALLRAARNDAALAEIQPVDLVQDIDGRWLVLADVGGGGRLIAISLSGFNDAAANPVNFINGFALGNGRIPRGIDLSYDGNFVYAIVSDQAAAPFTTLLRLTTTPSDLREYLPLGAPDNDRIRELPLLLAGVDEAQPDAIDVAVTPRDNFAYVLRRAADESPGGDVLIVDIELMEQLPPGLIPDAERPVWTQNADNQDLLSRALRRDAVVQGEVDFQTLAPLGRRLYVATHRPESFDGRIRVYDIDEASCEAGLRAIVEGCSSCDSAQPLVLATIRRFWLDRPMLESEPSSDDEFNLIDNFGERPLAPSNTVLREVIECIIAKGIAEGIPGPRGPQGEPGLPGQNGAAGAAGDRGPRGPGITEVRLESGPRAAELEPIAGDPENDQRLVLTLPEAEQAKANHVVGANFLHEELFDRERFVGRFSNQNDDAPALAGFLIHFEQPVLAGTLTNRTAYALIHLRIESIGKPVAVLPLLALPVRFDPEVVDTDDIILLNGYTIENAVGSLTVMKLATEQLVFAPDEEANGVLLCVGPEADTALNLYDAIVRRATEEPFPRAFDDKIAGLPQLCQVTVVLHGDQIMTRDSIYLDGNTMAKQFFPSGNGTPGGDWRAVMHLVLNQG